MFQFGFFLKQILKQGWECKWFIWELNLGRFNRGVGKRFRKGRRLIWGVLVLGVCGIGMMSISGLWVRYLLQVFWGMIFMLLKLFCEKVEMYWVVGVSWVYILLDFFSFLSLFLFVFYFNFFLFRIGFFYKVKNVVIIVFVFFILQFFYYRE